MMLHRSRLKWIVPESRPKSRRVTRLIYITWLYLPAVQRIQAQSACHANEPLFSGIILGISQQLKHTLIETALHMLIGGRIFIEIAIIRSQTGLINHHVETLPLTPV